MSTKTGLRGKKKVLRYSEAFKHRVVSEVEIGELSIQEARIKYGIKGCETIQKWIRKLGKNDLLCRIVRIENPSEVDQIKLLKARILELERALAQTQLECLQNEAYLHQACEQLGLELDTFKKKENTESTKSHSSTKD